MLCGIPFLSAFLSGCASPPLATGYVEGEFLLIAPLQVAEIVTLDVRRGDRVMAGDPLAAMEQRDAEIALNDARAALDEAQSRLADLREGRRTEEIRVIEEELASAREQAQEAERDARRHQELFDRGFSPQNRVDSAQTALNVALARVREMESNLAVAKLPARPWEIGAAEAAVDRALAGRAAAEWSLEQRRLTAPADGIVTNILRRAGEIAGPQAPVLEMLPDGAVVLRLYVPEKDIAALALGDTLKVGCDGCPDGLRATVTYIAGEPEFTPPVIYSLENRQKLVFLVEARPASGAETFKPGQIVDVRADDG